MAQRLVSTILWTLVSLNLIALVLGGLITWLGYAIPVRLRQFGLSPELTQMVGFASLLIATLGLCALNYSSHYALNAYGISCAAFIVFMLVGIMPDSWQQSINQQQLSSYQHQASHANYTSTLTGKSLVLKGAATASAKSGLVLDLIYFILLFVLAVLLLFAFILAQHFSRREREELELERQLSDEQQVGYADHLGGLAADCSCELITNGSSSQLGLRLNPAPGDVHLTATKAVNTCELAQGSRQLLQRQHQRANQVHHNNRSNLINDNLIRHRPTNSLNGSDSFSVPLHLRVRRSDFLSQSTRADLSLTRSLAKHVNDVINSDDLPPLISRGVYYAPNSRVDQQEARAHDSQERFFVEPNCERARGQRNYATSCAARRDHNVPDVTSTIERLNLCRCESAKTESVSSLAAKLHSNTLLNDNQFNNKLQYYNTMPSKFNPSSGYATTAPSQRMPVRNTVAYTTAKCHKHTKPTASSVMAMTAAAAAALLGGVVDPSTLDGNGGSGALLDQNFDDHPTDVIEDNGLEFTHGGGDTELMDHHQDSLCEFDKDHHELVNVLAASSLQPHSGQIFHRSLNDESVIDFSPMLDLSKTYEGREVM